MGYHVGGALILRDNLQLNRIPRVNTVPVRYITKVRVLGNGWDTQCEVGDLEVSCFPSHHHGQCRLRQNGDDFPVRSSWGIDDLSINEVRSPFDRALRSGDTGMSVVS